MENAPNRDTFFRKNERKGLLALLLLFLRGGKGLRPLLLLVALFSLLLVAPTSSLPGASLLGRVERALGLDRFFHRSARFAVLSSEFRTMRAEDASSWQAWYAQSRLAGGAFAGRSSLGLARGGKGLFGWGAAKDGILAYGKSDGGSVEIVDPSAVGKRRGDEVVLNDSRGFVGDASAGVFNSANLGSNLLAVRGGLGFPDSILGAGRDFLDVGDSLVPDSGRAVVAGRGRGRIAPYNWRTLKAGLSSSLHGFKLAASKSEYYKLTVANAFSLAGAPPKLGLCPSPACPAEFASHTAGVPFDGSAAGAVGLTMPTDPVAVTPDAGDIQNMINQANAADQAAQKCEQAQDQIGPQLQAASGTLDQLSQTAKQKCHNASSPADILICFVTFGLPGWCKDCKKAVKAVKAEQQVVDNLTSQVQSACSGV